MKRPNQLSRGWAWARALSWAAVALVASGFLPSRCPAGPQAAQVPSVPDAQASGAILERFRQMIWAESIYAEFELRQMPRRGEERLFHGRFWGGRNERGPVTRLEIDPGKGSFTHRFLIQGGVDGTLWSSDAGAPGAPNEAALLQPLVPGVEMTPLDVLPMPYLYWLDANMSGIARIRGRSSYAFDFTPSADFSSRNPGIRSVRAYLDTQYDALVQSEVSGADGRVSKTLSLLELKKVGDRWIPKDLDVRNEATRDKTRLTLTAVAIGAEQAPGLYDPAQLGASFVTPASKTLVRLSP